MSCIEGEALADRRLPGPQHKYNLKYIELLRPKTPSYVRMNKSVGRDGHGLGTTSSKSLKPSKSNGKRLGPQTY